MPFLYVFLVRQPKIAYHSKYIRYGFLSFHLQQTVTRKRALDDQGDNYGPGIIIIHSVIAVMISVYI